MPLPACTSAPEERHLECEHGTGIGARSDRRCDAAVDPAPIRSRTARTASCRRRAAPLRTPRRFRLSATTSARCRNEPVKFDSIGTLTSHAGSCGPGSRHFGDQMVSSTRSMWYCRRGYLSGPPPGTRQSAYDPHACGGSQHLAKATAGGGCVTPLQRSGLALGRVVTSTSLDTCPSYRMVAAGGKPARCMHNGTNDAIVALARQTVAACGWSDVRQYRMAVQSG